MAEHEIIWNSRSSLELGVHIISEPPYDIAVPSVTSNHILGKTEMFSLKCMTSQTRNVNIRCRLSFTVTLYREMRRSSQMALRRVHEIRGSHL